MGGEINEDIEKFLLLRRPTLFISSRNVKKKRAPEGARSFTQTSLEAKLERVNHTNRKGFRIGTTASIGKGC